jgi:hypothetical protein
MGVKNLNTKFQLQLTIASSKTSVLFKQEANEAGYLHASIDVKTSAKDANAQAD